MTGLPGHAIQIETSQRGEALALER